MKKVNGWEIWGKVNTIGLVVLPLSLVACVVALILNLVV